MEEVKIKILVDFVFDLGNNSSIPNFYDASSNIEDFGIILEIDTMMDIS